MSLKKQILIPASSQLRWLQYLVYGGAVLYFGRQVLVPVSFAVLVSFVLYPVCAWLERKGMGRLTAILIAVLFIVILGVLLIGLLVNQFMAFANEWPALQIKIGAAIQDMSRFLAEAFSLSAEQQRNILSRVSDQSGSNILAIVRDALSASAVSAVLLFLIPVYSVLILYYRHQWLRVFYRLFPSERSDSLRQILVLTIKTYYNFIKGMALVYLIVGILNSLGLLLLGIPHPFLFGFIASILTFIPYVGIIVGSLLPIAMAWITYDSILYPLGIVAIFTFVQYLEANIIFPVAVSSRLNVNTLVMLIAIFVGGFLWGVAGMILFVPFVGIAKLVADHNPKWKLASMILGMEPWKKPA